MKNKKIIAAITSILLLVVFLIVSDFPFKGLTKSLKRSTMSLACQIGFGEYCYKAANIYGGIYGGDNQKELHERGCALNYYWSCFAIGSIAAISPHSTWEYAYPKLKKACDNKVYAGCVEIGRYFYKRKDIEKAKPFFNKGCKNKEGTGCYYLGKILLSEGNIDESQDFFKKACKLGSEESCKLMKK